MARPCRRVKTRGGAGIVAGSRFLTDFSCTFPLQQDVADWQSRFEGVLADHYFISGSRNLVAAGQADRRTMPDCTAVGVVEGGPERLTS